TVKHHATFPYHNTPTPHPRHLTTHNDNHPTHHPHHSTHSPPTPHCQTQPDSKGHAQHQSERSHEQQRNHNPPKDAKPQGGVENYGSDYCHHGHYNNCADKNAFERPRKFRGCPSSGCIRPNSGKYQEPSQHHGVGIDWLSQEQKEPLQQCNFDHDEAKAQRGEVADPGPPPFDPKRSEEHTSELQSRGHLVCRLLLEKKK